jgi:hypothetical protein
VLGQGILGKINQYKVLRRFEKLLKNITAEMIIRKVLIAKKSLTLSVIFLLYSLNLRLLVFYGARAYSGRMNHLPRIRFVSESLGIKRNINDISISPNDVIDILRLICVV